jgi:hypothetical protein
MTIDNLLLEIKHGKDYIELKQNAEGIQSYIKESALSVSDRANNLLKDCDNSKTYIKKLSRAVRNFQEYESRVSDDKPISNVYARMKCDSIVEDINSAFLELENKKTLRESNQQNIGKLVATLKHGLNKISADKNITLKEIKESTGLISSYYKKETTLIESLI